MSETREFDVIMYGATGYTGRLVAEYLSQNYAGDVRWAMAGRSAEKLAAVRDEIGAPADTPLVVADADDPQSIADMVARAKCVATTVGPYQLYGEPLVAACAEAGTDYVDLCGEPAWMRQMIDTYEAKAKESGARIVFSCGFDSIPFDLGIWFVQQAAKEEDGVPSNRVRGRVRGMQGTFSGGTAASLKATMAAAAKDPKVVQLLLNPFSLTPGFTGADQPPGNAVDYEADIDSWVAPFIMAAINTRNVHRSNFLLGHPYGEDFVYDEMVLTGPGDAGEAAAKAVASDNSLASEDGPKPGEGPSKEEREAGFYDVLFIAEGGDGKTVTAGVTGDKDPGYGSTSKMIAESAICLVRDVPDAPGGIFTPAAIMAEPLIERLEANAGLTFKRES
ncbi:saccharopine dehydrogenase NADP-binding domain-containing protein [Parasphingopyxis sp.]|uniref:saccharopine dehydrogenase family protein n=1 Tax=Parasphingopyxis sp. TaxID=1920299 RepID=UPI0026262362|nr:saccharopine dehydrogenase NADP-binding domain-containing protein [Parasphingopyxis sp.]